MEAVGRLGRITVALLLWAGCGSDGNGAGSDATVCNPPPGVCDDGNPCTTDHADIGPDCAVTCSHDSVANCCGNGVVEAGESCDDGNVKPLDGCSPQCTWERALALDHLEFSAPGNGCDLDGDGHPDEVVNNAMNTAARNWLNGWMSGDLHKEPSVVLFVLLGLTDPTAQSGSVQLTFLQGIDTQTPPNYYSGQEPFAVTSMYLDAQVSPMFPMAVQLSGGQLTNATPTTMVLPYPLTAVYPFRMDRMILEGQITPGSDRPASIDITRMCASFAANSMYRVLDPDTISGPPTLLDAIVLGDQLFSYVVTGTQPDQDIDGDGLEMFFDDNGDRHIDRCVDGNGTNILGEDCPLDPRISDGYSMTMTMHAVGAVLAGQHP